MAFNRLIKSLVLALICLRCINTAADGESIGVVKKTDLAFPGYTLLAPIGSSNVELIALDGKVLHRWECDTSPGLATYLLDDGSLLRTIKQSPSPEFVRAGGLGGGVQRIAWDGTVLWEFRYSSSTHVHHHDIEPLPNGNVLMIAWERKSREDAIKAGRDPSAFANFKNFESGDASVWSESIIEIRPEGKSGGEIVWKWSVWDHLVQDFDSTKENFGTPRENPGLIDINYLKDQKADWIHANAIAYNPKLDQIMLSARRFNEVWIIDHTTTISESKGHTGGLRQKGGDLLYRWGNPLSYFHGFPEDQKLFAQHDAHWISDMCPGAGNILVFNNGTRQGRRDFSTVDEFIPPLRGGGVYEQEEGLPFGPKRFHWTYRGSFRSERISGVQRLPNGNTLICSGVDGQLIEVTPENEIAWHFRLKQPNGLRNSTDIVMRRRQLDREKRRTPGAFQSQGKGIARSERGAALFRAMRFASDHPAFAGRL